MILILIAMILGSINHLYSVFRDRYSYLIDYIAALFFGSILWGVAGLCIALILPMDTYEKKYSLNIEALQDNNNTSGYSYLGSGTIKSKMVYVFYHEENGLRRMEQIDCDSARIKYSDGIPKVNVTVIAASDSIINYFALDWNLGEKTYIIEVPRGTIKNNFNLDAQ